MLRLILKRCFGLSSQSLYQDQEFANSDVRDVVGHEEVGHNARQFVAVAHRTGRSLYVKTHELPPADLHPAIYVVRDGRSAVVSHAHYLSDILGRDISLAEVIEGKAGLSWSQHVRAWTLPVRANTLVTHYEVLAAGNRETLAAISAFISQPLLRSFDVSFDRLHALYPAFFGAVRMQPISGRWMPHRPACFSSFTAICCGLWVTAAIHPEKAKMPAGRRGRDRGIQARRKPRRAAG